MHKKSNLARIIFLFFLSQFILSPFIVISEFESLQNTSGLNPDNILFKEERQDNREENNAITLKPSSIDSIESDNNILFDEITNYPSAEFQAVQETQQSFNLSIIEPISYKWENSQNTSISIDNSFFETYLDVDPNQNLSDWEITGDYTPEAFGYAEVNILQNTSTNQLTSNFHSEGYGQHIAHNFLLLDWENKSLINPNSAPMILSFDFRAGNLIIPSSVEIYTTVRIKLYFSPNKTLFPTEGQHLLSFYLIYSDFFVFPDPDMDIPGTNYKAEKNALNNTNVFSANQTNASWEHFELNISQVLDLLYPIDSYNARELYSEFSGFKFEIVSLQNSTETTYFRSFDFELDNLSLKNTLKFNDWANIEISKVDNSTAELVTNYYTLPLQIDLGNISEFSIKTVMLPELLSFNNSISGINHINLKMTSSKMYLNSPQYFSSIQWNWSFFNPFNKSLNPIEINLFNDSQFYSETWIYWGIPITWNLNSSSNINLISHESSPLVQYLDYLNIRPLYLWQGGVVENSEVKIEFISQDRIKISQSPISIVNNGRLLISGIINSSVQQIIKIILSNESVNITYWLSSSPDRSFIFDSDISSLGILVGNYSVEIIIPDPIWYSYWIKTFDIQDHIENEPVLHCSIDIPLDEVKPNEIYYIMVKCELTEQQIGDLKQPVDWEKYWTSLKLNGTLLTIPKQLIANDTTNFSGSTIFSGLWPDIFNESNVNITLNMEINKIETTTQLLIWNEDITLTLKLSSLSINSYQNARDALPLYITLIGITIFLVVLKKRKLRNLLSDEI